MATEKRLHPVMSKLSDLTYAQAVDLVAVNVADVPPFSYDVNAVFRYSAVELVSELYGVDRRIVASDVVNARVRLLGDPR